MKFRDSEKNLYSKIILVKTYFWYFLMKLQFLNKNYGNFKVSHEKIPNFDVMC